MLDTRTVPGCLKDVVRDNFFLIANLEHLDNWLLKFNMLKKRQIKKTCQFNKVA